MKKFLSKGMLAGMLAATSLLATACPPPAAPALSNWTFKATKVTVNDSQDAVYDPLFGLCISLSGCSDEPYVLNVNFRVKIGVANSAQGFVTGSRDNAVSSLGAGSSANLSGGQQATATFSGIQGLDIVDLLDSNNHLEVWGSYVWALEEDTVGLATAANDTANILKQALNNTLATAALPSDPNFIVNLIVDNLGKAIVILGSNIPLFGLGDDVLGGGIYVGIGAKGSLGDIINTAIGSTTIGPIAIPVVTVPPDINRGGLYSMTGAKTFAGQSFSGAGGTHTYDFVSGPA